VHSNNLKLFLVCDCQFSSVNGILVLQKFATRVQLMLLRVVSYCDTRSQYAGVCQMSASL